MNYIVKSEKELFDAVDAVNNSAEPAEITVKSGIYEIEKSIVFTRDNITIKADGNVCLKGSRKIHIRGSGFTEIDLKSEGITDFGKFGEGPYEDFWEFYDIPKPHMIDEGPGIELFYNNKPMPISRYPESGDLKITKVLGETPLTEYGYTERIGAKEGKFTCNDENAKNWNMDEDLLLVGYWWNDWATQRHTVKFIDPKTGVIEVNPPYHNFGYRDGAFFNTPNNKGGDFHVLNLKSAVTKSGNWCIDRKNGKLYIIPYENQTEVNVSVCNDVFRFSGLKKIRISGFDISECRKCGIMMDDCSDCSVESCTIYNTGAWGVIADNCTGTSVLNCRIFDTAGGGVAVNGGNRNSLTSASNRVIGCEIHNIARWHKTYLAAIELNGVGCIAAENTLYDLPHFAILYQGNNHIIEKNNIKNACYSSNDAGAIYAGRDWTCRGNIIRYNYIHDFPGRNNEGCIGIYFDDAVSSAEVYGNIISGSLQAGIELGGGRDFKVHHNTFIDCRVSMMVDCRLKTWCTSNKLFKHLGEVEFRNKVWEKAYPELFRMLDGDYAAPEGNEYYGNLTIGGHGVAVTKDDAEKCLKVYDNTYIEKEIPETNDGRFGKERWSFPEKQITGI